jgi:hypothetical protein
MAHLRVSSSGALRFAIMIVLGCAVVAPASAQEKFTAEQVVARHLAAVAPAAALKNIEYLEMSGTVALRSTTTATLKGTAQVFSERNRVKFATKLPANDYPGEQFVTDGQKVQIAQIAPGRRSALGEFMFREPVLVSDGLVGGVLSAAWPLYDAKLRNAKLEYAGTTTINGRKAHQVIYSPKKKDSQLEIRLYFDAENFQHLRSLYRLKTADLSPAEASGRYVQPSEHHETIYEVQEDFRDFTKLGDFTFPLTEEVRYSTEFIPPWICEIRIDTINQQKVR